MSIGLTKVRQAKWLALIAMIVCLSLVFLDQTALPVGLVAIEKTFHIDATVLQWVLNIYLLAIAVLIIPCGRLADIYGAKRFFIIGIGLFGLASCLGAVSASGAVLLLGRMLQGVGAAMMLPSSAAIIASIVPLRERGKVMGIYIAIASLFLAIGPVVGGLLTGLAGWRWIFWLNVPLVLVSIALISFTIIQTKAADDSEVKSIDYLGFVWLVLSIVPGIVALLQGSVWGWSSFYFWLLLLISIVSLRLFIWYEKSCSTPLLNLSILSNNAVKIGILIVVLVQYAVISIAFWPSFLQVALHFTASEAGLGLMPVTLPIMFVAPISGHLMDKFGPRLPVALGTFCLVFGSFWVTLSAWTYNYWVMLPGLLIFGCGPSFILGCVMTFLFSVVEPKNRGGIAGFASFFRQIGSVIGLAVTSAILGKSFSFRLVTAHENLHSVTLAFCYSTFAITLVSLIIVILLRTLPGTLAWQARIASESKSM